MTEAHATANDTLIAAAVAVLRPHAVDGYGAAALRVGHVASALVSDSGRHFLGVCIDTGSGTGFCAEHAAIAAMVTAGDYRIMKIAAVWRDDEGVVYALPPCGRCREFIRQMDPANLDTQVVLGRTRSARLRDLLPEHEWPEPLG